MMDQCEKFTRQCLVAEFLGGSQKDRTIERKVLQGECQLVFITPEGLLGNERFRNLQRHTKIT